MELFRLSFALEDHGRKDVPWDHHTRTAPSDSEPHCVVLDGIYAAITTNSAQPAQGPLADLLSCQA